MLRMVALAETQSIRIENFYFLLVTEDGFVVLACVLLACVL